MKALILLAAAALLALPAPVPAQLPEPPEPPEPPADAQAQDLLAALREAVTTMRAEMFAPGPAVPGWNQGGADPDADLRRAGAEDHVFLITSGDGPSVVLLTSRSIAAVAPAGWRAVDSYGSSAEALSDPFVQFLALTPRYVLALRANSRRIASVDCSDPVTNAILYEVPDAPASPRDEDMPIFFRIALLAAEEQVVCSRYDRVDGGYRVRAFLPDGRSLPRLDDEQERIAIVPAAPIESLLKGRSSAAGEDGPA